MKVKHCAFLVAILVLAGCHHYKKVPKSNVVYIQIGDSITFGSRNNGGNSPGDFAVRALATPTTYMRLGWAAESAIQFMQRRQKQLLDSLRTIPAGQRVILGIAYGTNDLPQTEPRQVLANILRVAHWARDTAHVAEVLIIPVMNRKDKWGFTRHADGTIVYQFNEARLWLNKELHARAHTLSGVKVADEVYSPAMYAESYPDDTVRCADKVHPWDQGAKELGEGTIAHGIASFDKMEVR
ncbi:SGNH/GDSL hydrolase family protein [Hymenobacter negativus]|uniref:SGNH/GDSL hydrolase family protein n=1 Tax=Hymenobacter negativus TaxID=2795026 RepID=A0ABS3QND7_9BACT|nr:SGNH/GDSL hydrolase family protein [Hymenobacter negativus]MBO2012707.1 SGNH/GDSL hydrolase family protein [Hymenobacter negativus]